GCRTRRGRISAGGHQMVGRLAVLLLVVSCRPADAPRKTSSAPTIRETAPIATVDGAAISLDRFNALVDAQVSRLHIAGGTPAPQILQIKRALVSRLIDEEITRRAAERAGVHVAAAEVDAKVGEIKRSFGSDRAFQRHADT